MSVNRQLKELLNELNPKEPFSISSSTRTKKANRILNGPDQDPLYKSSQTKINKSYLVYTSPRKQKNNDNIFLLIPKNTITVSNENSYKIKNEIQNLNKNLGIKNISNNPKDLLSNSLTSNEKKLNFRNKPIINLNSTGFDFSPKSTIFNNYNNRSVVEPGIFKATQKLKDRDDTDIGQRKKLFNLRKIENIGNYSVSENNNFFSRNKNNDYSDYNRFMREMNGFKQRKLNQWKQQFIEANLKY